MPLHIDSIPAEVGKGALLRWLLESGEVKKHQVGAIDIRGRNAVIDIPENTAPRLAKLLDGKSLGGRPVRVWFSASQGLSAEAESHYQKLTRWLGMEERAEAEQAAEWRRAAGEHETSTGLRQLVVRSDDTGLGGHVLLRLGRRNPMQALPPTQLTVGAPVRLTVQAPPGQPSYPAIVTALDKSSIEVALNQPLAAESGNLVIQLDAAEDEIGGQRSRSALARAFHARGDRLSELRDVCLGLRDPQFERESELQPLDPHLNGSQRDAVQFALAARDIAVIHGPPGTGKTTTLVELILQTVRQGHKVLACAPSNLGVDNLFERLLGRGANVLRIGHVARVLPHLQTHTLRVKAREHRRVREVKKLRTDAADLFRKADRPSAGNSRYAFREQAKDLLGQAREAESAIVQELIDAADILCATNTGLDPDLLGARGFELVVIDEACQCTEPSCWIPLTRAQRAVLAGDHCQLPPTILSQAAAREGFNISLQERLVQLYGDRISHLLVRQYRMHEEIMRYSSATFYDNRLEADPTVASHLLAHLPGVGADELASQVVRFIDTSGAGYREEQEPAGHSLFNPDEARLAVKKASDLLALGVQPGDIAIITPYTAQVRCVRELLPTDAIEAGSVDGFQGREKEAVIISLVRSNPAKEIGFLSDVRRMNVALTRARRKLIVIGDSATISGHPFYDGLLAHFGRIDAYHVVWEEEVC